MNNSVFKKETKIALDKIEIDCTTNGYILSCNIMQDDYEWITQRFVYQNDEIEDMKNKVSELLLMDKKDT